MIFKIEYKVYIFDLWENSHEEGVVKFRRKDMILPDTNLLESSYIFFGIL